MPTRIYLERLTEAGEWVPHPVSTAVFSHVRTDSRRYRPAGGDWDYACRDFRDVEVGHENIFLRDTRSAIDSIVSGDKPPAPSFLRFKQTLIEGRLFAIVTARGHAPTTIRRGVEYFVDAVLTDQEKSRMLANLRGYLECFEPEHGSGTDAAVLAYYLGLNRYHGVRSPAFRELILHRHGAGPGEAERGKQFALRDFVEHIVGIARDRGLNRPISIGFSDDDYLNATSVETYIREELSREFPTVKFAVYYTSDPDHPAGRKVEVHGQLNLPFTAA